MPTIAKTSHFEGEESPAAMLLLENDLLDMDEELVMVLKTAKAEALESTSFMDMQQCLDKLDWWRAMKEKYTILTDMGTWRLEAAPPSANIIGSKWTYKAKWDASGAVICKKACLVAQGFLQVPGVDYFDTFTPVACLSSICTVLALATHYNMELHQIDIKRAYLNGEPTSDETIYMHQPPGFISATHPKHVCHLVKTLYRLKQSGQCWYQKLVKILAGKLRFSCCDVDQVVFFK